jgi:hypothetical protein
MKYTNFVPFFIFIIFDVLTNNNKNSINAVLEVFVFSIIILFYSFISPVYGFIICISLMIYIFYKRRNKENTRENMKVIIENNTREYNEESKTNSNTKNITPHNKNIEIIVSRFNEDLAWANEPPFSKYPVICYNKGINNNYKVNNLKKEVKLNNVGRESHTYLYHIINNYENLADITVFLPGSVNTDIYNKWKRANILMNNIDTHDGSLFIGPKYKNVREDLYDFKINEYKSTNENNNLINHVNKLEMCSIRPYGKWYENKFPGIDIKYVSYNGIFAVSKEDILKKTKKYYENLIEELTNHPNPEAGHYFERSWVAVFYPTTNPLFIETGIDL